MNGARLLYFAAVLLAGPAEAWDPAGHMLVGQIAWEQTRPEIRERVGELVKSLDNTYNEGQPYNFITAGCWMDDMRSKKGYEWAKWHYVNVSWTADGVAFELPEPPHVVWAIEESLRTLSTERDSLEKRSQAVAMLMHFVGDVHQPMHATERGDRGGNGVLVTGVPFADLWPGTKPNLHAFWDKAFRFDQRDGKIIEAWPAPLLTDRPKGAGERIIAEEAAKIVARFPAVELAAEIANSDVKEWTRESHRLGCIAGYPADFQPSDHHVVELTPEFAVKSREIASRRIALSGYRLARVLNNALGP